MADGLKRAVKAARATRASEPKPSKPQMTLLRELPANIVDSYPPAKKLVELGLAQWSKRAFGDRLERTPEGEAVLVRHGNPVSDSEGA